MCYVVDIVNVMMDHVIYNFILKQKVDEIFAPLTAFFKDLDKITI